MSSTDALAEQDGFIDLAPGPWDPSADPRVSAEDGVLLVVRGIVYVDLEVKGRPAIELLGPGDLFPVARGNFGEPVESGHTSMSVLHPARVYLFDDKLEEAIAQRPAFGAQLITAAAEAIRARALHRGLAQLPRVEDRVLGMLWLLADQFGTVTPAAVELELDGLTHEMLGRLIGAQRPTVTMAMTLLTERGDLTREGGRYLLAHDTWPAR